MDGGRTVIIRELVTLLDEEWCTNLRTGRIAVGIFVLDDIGHVLVIQVALGIKHVL